MKIRVKVLLIVLPLLVAAITMVGLSSYLLASSSVTRLAVEFLAFMSEEIQNYADSQWNLLVENNVVGEPLMETAAKEAVQNFSQAILRSQTESIFALNSSGQIEMQAGSVLPSEEECSLLLSYHQEGTQQFIGIHVAGIERAAYTLPFRPFSWQIFVTEDRTVFYGAIEGILRTSLYILCGALILGIAALLILTGYLTKPIEVLVKTMRNIIKTNDFHAQVPVYYDDEIGQLSHTFNHMQRTLANAYDQIKQYAFDTALAQKREMKIRNVFQLYVPKDVIEEVFVNPEKMLVGNNREVSILFSDIRSFTTISENLTPDDLVNSLNRYFSTMVNIIVDKQGLVDKYIGDAIMAIFGVPMVHKNDALSSVIAGLEMISALDSFNQNQVHLGAPEFHIGVGINYGIVTVGNIGCDKKMNYTVIGDAVNLASRLEGLTKIYKEPILFSDSVHEKIADNLHCRTIDRVAVKGKTQGIPIFTSRLHLTETEEEAWKYHEAGVLRYYKRNFQDALKYFDKLLTMLPSDSAAKRFRDRCRVYMASPPPDDWDGVEIMTEK
jgi:class 3 adenylate cyclase/HAMP domain-containing protein